MRNDFIYPKLDMEKRQSEPHPPAHAGGRQGGQGREVIRWTRGLRSVWHDLPIKNIIAFDFYKYQG